MLYYNPSFILVDFLVADQRTTSRRTVVMATPQQLQLLAAAKTWFIDGTFKVVKAPFYQLLSVHSFVENGTFTKHVPLGFVLMCGKRTTEYQTALSALKAALPSPPQVREILVDFKRSIWKAITRVLPEVTVLGCVSHWKQAVLRKVQAAGLGREFARNADTKQLIKEVLTLPFLPPNRIQEVFDELWQRSNIDRLDEVFTYIQATWIEGPYPLESWSVFGRAARTNNDCEGWHHKLNSRAGGKAMGIYQLSDLLAREAAVADLTANLVNSDTMTGQELLRACSQVYGNVKV